MSIELLNTSLIASDTQCSHLSLSIFVNQLIKDLIRLSIETDSLNNKPFLLLSITVTFILVIVSQLSPDVLYNGPCFEILVSEDMLEITYMMKIALYLFDTFIMLRWD